MNDNEQGFEKSPRLANTSVPTISGCTYSLFSLNLLYLGALNAFSVLVQYLK